MQGWPTPGGGAVNSFSASASKVATLNIGLEDTLAYYSPDDFVVAQACVLVYVSRHVPTMSRRFKATGFKKTMAFQPRVIKQNRGSSGEGIWIIKLAEGNYCKDYGERSCEDGEVLKLMEANDNHEETHTVAEFIEFCVSGRTDKSGEWTSKGVGKYLEGGKEAGGQLVDQRFCPRIVEGRLFSPTRLFVDLGLPAMSGWVLGSVGSLWQPVAICGGMGAQVSSATTSSWTRWWASSTRSPRRAASPPWAAPAPSTLTTAPRRYPSRR